MIPLHHSRLPGGWNWRAQVDQMQGFQDRPRVWASARRSSALTLVLQTEAHQPYRGQRLHCPLRRQIHPRLLESSAQQTLNKQRQRRDEDVRLHPRLDLVIDRPQRNHVLELPEPTLHLRQLLVRRHNVQDAQSLLTRRNHIFSFDLLLTPQPRLALAIFESPSLEL